METMVRDLRRRFHQTKDLKDEVIYIQAALKDNQLTEEAVGVAAYVGYPAADVVMSARTSSNPKPSENVDLTGWVLGLQYWGKPALVEAARSAAVTTLRIASVAEASKVANNWEVPNSEQLKQLHRALKLAGRYATQGDKLLKLSGELYNNVYERSPRDPLKTVASTFIWLCNAAHHPFESLVVLPEHNVPNCVYSTVQTVLNASHLAPNLTKEFLRKDLAAWALEDPTIRKRFNVSS